MARRILVLTGQGRRHRYVVNRWAQQFDLVGVVSERKRPVVPDATLGAGNAIVASHFAERDQAEVRHLPDSEQFSLPAEDVLVIEKAQVNHQPVFQWIQDRHPDILLLFGCSLVKEPLASYYSGKMINMHLGLSPYYRGAASNFWPFVYDEPECVGVTLHVPVERVDAGPILIQGRPGLSENDSCHDAGCKAIESGVVLLEEAVNRLRQGKQVAGSASGVGHVFRRDDVTAEHILTVRRNLSNGMLRRFLENPARFSRFPIVT